jgi:16S rRNA (cytosine967-C5)-methyltransferase
MVNHFKNQYRRKDGTDIIKSCNVQPKVYIRLNTVLSDEQKLKETLLKQGAHIQATQLLKDAYILDFGGDITRLEAFQTGMFFVQDLSSQFCVCELSLKKEDVFIDMCSAPGSKSFTASVL